MFATPFSALSPTSPERHFFGRFMPRSDSLDAGEAMDAPALAPPAMDDDAMPDLAQRVREVGEW
ncbi:hypothetical protein [Acidovorax sp.]|uniref:hypothetical protein n=1 Tax=Acidovorax sp. TaxID=1872122 RepID=UPI002631AFC4|nr:hypothetical protein [Acidovorax sp.]